MMGSLARQSCDSRCLCFRAGRAVRSGGSHRYGWRRDLAHVGRRSRDRALHRERLFPGTLAAADDLPGAHDDEAPTSHGHRFLPWRTANLAPTRCVPPKRTSISVASRAPGELLEQNRSVIPRYTPEAGSCGKMARLADYPVGRVSFWRSAQRTDDEQIDRMGRDPGTDCGALEVDVIVPRDGQPARPERRSRARPARRPAGEQGNRTHAAQFASDLLQRDRRENGARAASSTPEWPC
jgi:hypothetical protein